MFHLSSQLADRRRRRPLVCILPSACNKLQHPLNRHCKHALYPNDKEVLKLCYVIVEIKCEECLELTYPVWQLGGEWSSVCWTTDLQCALRRRPTAQVTVA